MPNSLAFRVIATGIFIGGGALIVTGILLVFLFRDHIEQHFDALIFDHIEELVAASSFTPEGDLKLSWYPQDPRFHRAYSGWYWEILQSGHTIERSLSLKEKDLNVPDRQGKGVLQTLRKNRLLLSELQQNGSMQMQQFLGPNQRMLRGLMLEMPSSGTDNPLTYVVTGPLEEINDDVGHFENQIIVSFLVMSSGLLLAVGFQVRTALKPLRQLKRSITDLHQGRSERIPGSYPVEVQVVINELNALLEQNTVILERARRHLGNFAHSVKNPLTVISVEADNCNDDSRKVIQAQTGLITATMNRHLSQARAAGAANLPGVRTHVQQVVEDLCFCMDHVYHEKDLEIITTDLEGFWFRGEAQDLEEMLGNLLDNACKWTQSRVWIQAAREDNRLEILIEDNGPGISDKMRKEVIQRGRKLDETVSGHGLGLNIVIDIAELYTGSLILSQSSHGGLCAKLNLPASEIS